MAETNLLVIIGAKTNELKDALEGAQKEVSGFSSKLASGLKVAAGAALAVGTAAVGAGVASLKAFGDAGEEITLMSQKTGMGAEMLSQLKYALETMGGSLSAVQPAFKSMSSLLSDAAAGGETSNKALEALGLNIEALKAMSPDQAFNTLALAVADVSDQYAKADLAAQVFGKAGMDLLPIFADGSDGLKQLAADAQAAGVVMTEESAASANALGDAMDKLDQTMMGVMQTVGAALAPAITPLIEAFSQLIQALPLKEFGELLNRLLPPLAEVLIKVMKAIPIEAVLSFVVDALSPLLDILSPILDAFSPILEILGKILKLIPIKPFMELVMRVLEPLLIPALKILTSLLEGLMPILEVVFGVIEAILNVLTPVLEAIAKVVGFVAEGVGGFIGDVVGGVGNFFKGIFGIGDGIVQNGRIITTDPADYILATRDLSGLGGGGTTIIVNAPINGWVGNDQDVAARLREQMLRMQGRNYNLGWA